MHKVKNFVNVIIDEDPDEFIDEIISRVENEGWINSAREYAARHTDTQRQADRLVQEIVIRYDPIDRPDILGKMPLVEPEVDHQQIGETQVAISKDGESITIKLKIRAVVDLNPDGTIVPRWLIYKEIEIHERFWDGLRRVMLYTGDIGDGNLAETETDQHVDDLILGVSDEP